MNVTDYTSVFLIRVYVCLMLHLTSIRSEYRIQCYSMCGKARKSTRLMCCSSYKSLEDGNSGFKDRASVLTLSPS